MMGIDDVARIFDISPETIKEWYAQGWIKTFHPVDKRGPLFCYEDIALACLDKSIRELLEQ